MFVGLLLTSISFSAPSTHTASRARLPRMQAKPDQILGVASLGMGLVKPLFKAEAQLQARVLLGDREAARAQIEADVASASVVVYTYGLSPFSSECIGFLTELGAKHTKIELGLEWFLLGPKTSAMRAELAEMTGQSSLPHIFVNGASVGGLYSGNDVGKGLAALQSAGELEPLLKAAGAL